MHYTAVDKNGFPVSGGQAGFCDSSRSMTL